MEDLNNYSIEKFFSNLYGQQVIEKKEGKNTVYNCPIENSVKIIIDQFGGCHLDLLHGNSIPSNMKNEITLLSQYIKETKKFDSLWIDLNIPAQANVFGICPDSWVIGNPEKGNIIQDTREKKIRVWQWLNDTKSCKIPAGATHNLGATAAVIDEIAQKILLVQNIRRKGSWNLPGGSFEPAQDSPESTLSTALRELKEEAGITAEGPAFLVGEIIFPTNQYAPAINQVWKVIFNDGSKITPIPEQDEVLKAVWVSFEDVRKGTFDGLTIGDEIKEAVKATTGFFKLEGSKNWMQLYFQK